MIISASRRTDIPTYYSNWFFNRVMDGYVLVRNPMNAHQISKIALNPDVVDGIVFWTKNPIPMLNELKILHDYMYYFQFTLNSYAQDVEAHVPNKQKHIIPAFKKLSDMIGPDRVIWRYDPIFLNDTYTPEYHIRYFERIAKELSPYTKKCTISFIDFYRNTSKNVSGLSLRDFPEETQKSLAKELAAIAHSYGLLIDTCAEGIELQTLKAPSSIDVDENHHVKGIYVTPQMVSSIRDGRASIKPTGEEDIYIPCDVLIVAIGQNIETHHFEQAGIPVERGKIVTKSTGAFENLPGVFAGGDCVTGPATVIRAIAAGKVAAANIDEYLGYHHEISCDVEIPEAHLDDRTPCGRVNLTEREACERVCDFEAVENCMTEKEAKQEAGRCLRCDHFGYGIFKGGRETLW